MFVSTMDGRVSALNVGKEGEVEWSVDAGASLVSSSIGNIEVIRLSPPSFFYDFDHQG